MGENSWESFELQGDQTSQSKRKSILNAHWKDCSEAEAPVLWPFDTKNWLIGKDSDAGKDWGLEEKGGDSECDGCIASPAQRTWVWVN